MSCRRQGARFRSQRIGQAGSRRQRGLQGFPGPVALACLLSLVLS